MKSITVIGAGIWNSNRWRKKSQNWLRKKRMCREDLKRWTGNELQDHCLELTNKKTCFWFQTGTKKVEIKEMTRKSSWQSWKKKKKEVSWAGRGRGLHMHISSSPTPSFLLSFFSCVCARLTTRAPARSPGSYGTLKLSGKPDDCRVSSFWRNWNTTDRHIHTDTVSVIECQSVLVISLLSDSKVVAEMQQHESWELAHVGNFAVGDIWPKSFNILKCSVSVKKFQIKYT